MPKGTANGAGELEPQDILEVAVPQFPGYHERESLEDQKYHLHQVLSAVGRKLRCI